MSHHNNPLSPSNSITLANPFSTKIKILILLILWATIFFPIYPELVQTWLKDSNNSHGLLVPMISLFFIWKQREQLKAARIHNSGWGLFILIVSLMLYIISYAGNVAFVSRSTIIFSLVGLILFTLGRTVHKLISFPLLFLVFMVPVPDSILNLVAFPLQLQVTNVSSFVIHALSIPAYQEGNMLYFAQTQLEVAEACSGIRSIMSLAMLSVIFVFLMKKGRWRKIVILASVIPIAFFANTTRVSATGILAHYFDETVARGFLHNFSGIAVFALGFILLFFEYWLLNGGHNEE